MENITYGILVINPGSTSTKIALFENERLIFKEKVNHSTEELEGYENIMAQHSFRRNLILQVLRDKNVDEFKIKAVVGRGGLIKPVEGGTYLVNEKMLDHLKHGLLGEHASNLGGILVYEIGRELDVPAYVVDPPVVDEMDPIAKITGLPEIKRRSVFHALNQKAVARKVAEVLGKKYEELNLIIAHLGGGITVGAHNQGQVVNVNNALDGEGPFSPERVGELPAKGLANLIFSKGFTFDEVKKLLAGKGGLVAHFGTNDAQAIRKRIEEGDETAKLVFEAMAYQVAREIGACAAVLSGRVDAVVLTGGLAHEEGFVEWIKERVAFIAQVFIFPGEHELKALAQGDLRVLTGQEKPKEYS